MLPIMMYCMSSSWVGEVPFVCVHILASPCHAAGSVKSNVMKLKESRPKDTELEEADRGSAGVCVDVDTGALEVEATAEDWNGTEEDEGGGVDCTCGTGTGAGAGRRGSLVTSLEGVAR